MVSIVIASKNPVKIQAVRVGFERMFPGLLANYESVSVHSGVGSQPLSDQETLNGAINRAKGAMAIEPHANYWVGVEGGVECFQDEMTAFAWVVVLTKQKMGKGRTGAFFLPEAITSLIHQGMELGEADDIVFGRSNSKQENGAIGLLTGDVIDRAQLYQQAVIFALIPFKNTHLYEDIPEKIS